MNFSLFYNCFLRVIVHRVFFLFLCVMIIGCSSSSDLKNQEGFNAGLTPSPDSPNKIARAQYWQALYENDNTNAEIGVKYAESLYDIGSLDKASEVYDKLMVDNHDNIAVILNYSKFLSRTKRLKKAAKILKYAHDVGEPNWEVYLARGIVFDKMLAHESAQQMYTKALSLNPYEAKIMNNLAMSHLLAGDLKTAENIFNQIFTQGTGNLKVNSKIRQNLALAIALQGRFEEAENIIESELSPKEARENIAYIRKVIKNRSNWNDLRNLDSASIQK